MEVALDPYLQAERRTDPSLDQGTAGLERDRSRDEVSRDAERGERDHQPDQQTPHAHAHQGPIERLQAWGTISPLPAVCQARLVYTAGDGPRVIRYSPFR